MVWRRRSRMHRSQRLLQCQVHTDCRLRVAAARARAAAAASATEAAATAVGCQVPAAEAKAAAARATATVARAVASAAGSVSDISSCIPNGKALQASTFDGICFRTSTLHPDGHNRGLGQIQSCAAPSTASRMQDLPRRTGERGCRCDWSWRPGAPAATAAGTRPGGCSPPACLPHWAS